MKKWRHNGWLILALAALLGVGWMADAPLVAQSEHAASATTPPIQAVDADDHRVTLNARGRITVVFLCSEQTQKEIRDAAGKIDPFRGLEKFRVVAVVDLRDSLGSMVGGIVKWRMQDDLDDEAERLTPYYRANGNQKNPRPDLSAVPDFNGAICKALGWPKVSNKLRAVVFGPDGKALKRWDDLENYQELYDVVEKALKS